LSEQKNLYQISKYSRNPGVTQYFKRYCKILKSTTEASKRKYYDQIIYNSDNRTKTIWNIVKTLTNKRGDVKKITSIHLNNELVKDPTITANSFNSFFSTIIHSLSSESPDNEGIRKLLRKHTPETLELTEPFHFKPTKTNEIDKIIRSLKNRNSHGYDEASSKILKISAPYIIPPLTYIFNQILRAGIFPDRMKCAIIKPLHKKGSTKEMKNYKPISLITTFAKVLESHIQKALLLFGRT